MRQHWWSRLAQLGRPRRILLAGLAAIYILSLVVFLVTPRAYRTPPVWDGYFTVSTDQDSIRAEALLRDAGASDVITEHTSDVFVTRFSRVDEVPLSTALDQLDPLDPRRDPYIRNLSRYFASDGDSRSLLYVATDQSPRATARMVRRVLGPRSSVAEYRPARRIAGLIVFAVGLSVALIGSGRHWQAVIVGALPLVISVFGAGINGGLSGALILLVWLRALQDADGALEQADSRPGAVPAIYRAGLWLALVIAASVAVLWALNGVLAAATLLPAVAGLAAVTGALFMIQLGGSIHRDHDLFAPVSILSGRAGSRATLSIRARPVLIVSVVVALLGAPIAADRITLLGVFPAPRPIEPAEVEDASFASITALWLSDHPDSLPDMSDYVAHRAYQESLAFGREYALPQEDESVTLSRFRETDSGAYNRFAEEVMVFDSAWLDDAIRGAPKGIMSMVIAAAGVSGVVLIPERGLYSGCPQVLIHAAYVLLALSPVVLSRRRVRQLGRGRSKVVEIARRRKQVA